MLNNLNAFSVSVARLGRGLVADPNARTPEKHLELYEFEGCPYCRKVREAMTELDLNYVCRTTPKGEGAKRAFVREQSGRAMFPFLVDPNTGRQMNQSEDIITYLHNTYGSGRMVLGRMLSPLNTIGSSLATVLRPLPGVRVRKGHGDRQQPEQILELYNFEASPYCRKVRERLCELNLDSLVHNVGKLSKHRPELVARGGKMMVPYLIDPNTGTEMYESDDIVAYLDRTYGS